MNIKQRLLKIHFIQNYFRKQRGWPSISNGPNGKSILVINPHWDDDILSCYGTLYNYSLRVTVTCMFNELGNPYLGRPYLEVPFHSIKLSHFDTIFLPAPWDDHPVHVQASKINVPDNVTVWAFQNYLPIDTNTVVDITANIDEKIRMLKEVQKLVPGQRDWTHYALGRDAYSARHLHRNDKRYAELFMVLRGKDYKTFREEYFACCKS